MFDKKKYCNDNAINEIVGTMLLLGISVSIFSIVYISVLTIPYPPSTPSSNIYFSLDETKIVLTHFGGKELDLESNVRIMIGDEPQITVNVGDLLEDEDGDNYWGFGEQLVYIDTTGLVLENPVEVIVTDLDSNSVVIIGRKMVITNRAPVITSPSRSTSDLNINIFDPDGDAFNWIIWTNPDIGSNNSIGESDGVKTCSISGLEEGISYTWYVNVTDPTGSGEWTNKTYTFTAGENNPPIFSNVNPVNEASGVSVDISSLSLTIEDPEGDLFDWIIETFPDIGSNYGIDDVNGSKSCSVSSLTYSTTYTWYVNATDPSGSGEWTNNTYTFITRSETGNNPPIFSNVNPVNEASGVSVDISSLSLTIEDPEGDLFDWIIETFPDIGSNNGNGDSNGSKSCSVSSLTYSTTYTWYVNATDPSGSGEWTNNTYTFTTESEPEWTLLTYDDFEGASDFTGTNYTDGGADCIISTDGTYAHQGSNSANIQADSDDASSFYHTANNIDVDTPGYTSLRVDFWFITEGFNANHDFFVEYYDGSVWTTVVDYDCEDEFINGLFYHETIWINETSYTFPTDMKIKFRCDASNIHDDLYIDEILVQAKT